MISDRVGLQLYSLRDYFHNAKDLALTLEKVKEMGYSGIELACLDSMPHSSALEAVKQSGLKVVGSHIGFGRFLNELPAVIDELHDYECENAVIPIVIEKQYRSYEGALKIAEKVHMIAAQLSAEGISLHYHNHNHEMCQYGGETWLRTLLNNTQPSELKAEFDTYWIQVGGGDPVQYIDDYAGRQTLVHLKDAIVESHRLSDDELGYRLRAGIGAELRITEVGNGNMNIGAILKAGVRAGADWFIVEQDEAFNKSAMEACRISLDNLVRIGGDEGL